MKKPIIFILTIFFSTILFAQKIDKILYRGDSVNVYPKDSITMVDIGLIENLPDGHYCGFFKGDTSFLRLSITYLNNRIDGKVIEYYYENDEISGITNYKNGIKHGKCVTFDHFTNNKEILCERFFENGKQEGFEYCYSGKIGNRNVYSKSFYRNDTLVYNVWKGRDSTYYRNDTGFVFKFDYKGNLKAKGQVYNFSNIGYWEYYYPNGNIESKGNYKFSNEKPTLKANKNGIWFDFYENGQISRKYLCDCHKPQYYLSTIYEQYDVAGNLVDSMSFVDGVGWLKDYFPNGLIKREQYFLRVDFLKIFKEYTEEGKTDFIEEYFDDLSKIRTTFYPNGIIKSIENFKPTLIWKTNEVVDYYKFGEQIYYNEDGSINRKEKVRKQEME